MGVEAGEGESVGEGVTEGCEFVLLVAVGDAAAVGLNVGEGVCVGLGGIQDKSVTLPSKGAYREEGPKAVLL